MKAARTTRTPVAGPFVRMRSGLGRGAGEVAVDGGGGREGERARRQPSRQRREVRGVVRRGWWILRARGTVSMS